MPIPILCKVVAAWLLVDVAIIATVVYIETTVKPAITERWWNRHIAQATEEYKECKMYKLDTNHTEIAEAFRRCGCRVAEIARSKSDVAGIPDLLVGIPNHDAGQYRITLVEVKTDAGRLSPAQEAFAAEWVDYPVHVVRSVDDVVRMVTNYQKSRTR